MNDLLNLIRTGDLSDRVTYGELKAKLWCWLNKVKYAGAIVYWLNLRDSPDTLRINHIMELPYERIKIHDVFEFNNRDGKVYYPSLKPYVHSWKHDDIYALDYMHSLDVLKDVQNKELKGWLLEVKQDKYGWRVWLQCPKTHRLLSNKSELPTINLAWMDALVQAIAWKRELENENE